jgi:hypothetical protein
MKGFLSLLLPIVTPFSILLGAILHAWISNNPNDADRAATLEKIAQGAADLCVSLYPNSSWSELLKSVIAAITSAPGVPTSSAKVIEQAAATALANRGKLPPGK